MKDNPSLSIVIPAYKVLSGKNLNYFRTLLESIQSNILNKDVNLKEIIIVNDYVQINCQSELKEVFNAFQLEKYFVYVQNENNIGQAASRNIGLNLSNGDYIHFIDQDDFINSSFYENALTGEKSDLLLCNINHYYSITSTYFNPVKKNYKRLLRKKRFVSDLKLLLFVNIAFSPGQYLIKRSVCLCAGGFPDLKFKGTDDYGFLYNLAFKGHFSFRFCENSIFFYRKHSNQNRRLLNMRKSHLEFFNLVSNKNRGVIWYIKTNKFLSYIFTRLIYIFYFNRAKY